MANSIPIVILVLCVFSIQTLVAKATVHERRVSLSDTKTDEEDGPDLQAMLDVFKGGSDIQTLTNFLHEYKKVRDLIQPILTLSPLFHRLVMLASKESVKLRVLLKIINGQFPDVKDMYDLVTSKDRYNISLTLYKVELKDKDFQRFNQLIEDPELLQSNTKIIEVSELVTGHKFNVSEAVVNLVRNGQYPTSLASPVLLNALELFFFLAQNYGLIGDNVNTLLVPGADHVKPLDNLLTMNTTHLVKILALPQTINNVKYSVTGPKGGKKNQGVLGILQDIQAGKLLDRQDPNVQENAEKIILDMALHIIGLISETLKSNAALNKNSDGSPVLG